MRTHSVAGMRRSYNAGASSAHGHSRMRAWRRVAGATRLPGRDRRSDSSPAPGSRPARCIRGRPRRSFAATMAIGARLHRRASVSAARAGQSRHDRPRDAGRARRPGSIGEPATPRVAAAAVVARHGRRRARRRRWLAGAPQPDGQRVRRALRHGNRRAAHPGAVGARLAARQGRRVGARLAD